MDSCFCFLFMLGELAGYNMLVYATLYLLPGQSTPLTASLTVYNTLLDNM
jgi:hypothetical protein